MNLTALSVRHRGAIAAGVGILCLLGFVSITDLPLQLLPDINTPQISIFNNWRSAAPEEVEEAIVQPQEEVLRSTPGLESIVSNSSRGQGQINLNFQVGFDMQQALIDVINRLNQTPGLPPDASEPVVSSGSGDGLPGAASLLIYAIPGNPVTDMTHYQEVIEDTVQPRLARIPGVARVNLTSLRPKQVDITVNPFSLVANRLQVNDVANALTRARDVSGGFVDMGRKRFTVRFLGEQNVAQLNRLVVGWRNGQPVHLGDVATVKVNFEDGQNVTLRNGLPSFYISIARKNDANTIDVLDRLNAAIVELNKGPLEAAGLRTELSFDASLHIRRAISMVRGNLLLGMLLATLVLYYFLRNARATLMVAMTVPVSLLFSFITLDMLGLSLNVISLAGLALAVGMVMDAAIVVQENIFRLRQSGLSRETAVIKGTGQVSGALFSSTLTTVAIFVPILFMKGVEGQLFKDLAITISVAVLASMLVALTVLPALTSRWLAGEVASDRLASVWDKLAAFIIRLTRKATARIGWILGILGLSIAFIWFAAPKIDFLPKTNIDAIYVYFSVPPGTNTKTIEEDLGRKVVNRFAPYLSGEKSPGIRAYNFASFNGFSTQAYIYPRDPASVDELIEKLRTEILADIPDVNVYVSQASMLQVGNGGGRGINVDIQGKDISELLRAAKKGQQVISKLWKDTNVFSPGGLSLDEPELQVVPNDRRINNAGIDRATLGNTIRAYTGGLYAGDYFDGNRRMDMMIRTAKWNSPEQLLALPVWTPGAGVQNIGDLAGINRSVGPTTLQRVNGLRTVTLYVTPPPGITMEEALDRLEAVATPAIKAELPATASVKYRGNADRLKEALSQVTKNFVLAMVILFMIMAALFRNPRDASLVMLGLPPALAGGLAGLKLLNLFVYQSLDMLTLIGFIILLGLVVNNAILLVDQTRKAEASGLGRADAVAQAIRFRARPIFMSSLTSIVGMLPLMLVPGVGSEIYRGLATVIVSGMVVSGLVTLVLLPALLRMDLKDLLGRSANTQIIRQGRVSYETR